ncbi:MAG: hypothetical protein Harvfovirus56_2 [Harvfovirus sp.]|uniref:Uncharacterized protein n=1 Tax=Harvfovirus sp. TaxID=2487768 RepID=A0A3G5A3C3_9VIRU|nr:MAG: hypothetical protein Harvfovirus56_2 [Harvfovirus sp.]
MPNECESKDSVPYAQVIDKCNLELAIATDPVPLAKVQYPAMVSRPNELVFLENGEFFPLGKITTIDPGREYADLYEPDKDFPDNKNRIIFKNLPNGAIFVSFTFYISHVVTTELPTQIYVDKYKSGGGSERVGPNLVFRGGSVGAFHTTAITRVVDNDTIIFINATGITTHLNRVNGGIQMPFIYEITINLE